jgi:hypothetical protein
MALLLSHKAPRIDDHRRRREMTISKEIIAALIGAAVTLVVVGAASLIDFWGKERAMDVKMVEIAVGILRTEPTENTRPVRDWAVDVLGHYSKDVPLSEGAREALKGHRLGYDLGGGWDYSMPLQPK